MATAVITFVYNESINLPIWRRYYAAVFGEKNLFVIDHSSSDGTTADLGSINKLVFPREELEEHKRCIFVSEFVKGLLEYFDTVIYTDCDEIIVPDLAMYADLKEYIERNDFPYRAGVGLNLTHIISHEPPLDPEKPILQQRNYVWFRSTTCKPLVTRVPISWDTGFHFCNQPINIDPNLYIFHLKAMDYEIALKRQKLTREMKWAANSIAAGHAAHQRYEDERFAREQFLDPNRVVLEHGVSKFDFSEEIARIEAEVKQHEGLYVFGHWNGKIALLPERLRNAF